MGGLIRAATGVALVLCTAMAGCGGGNEPPLLLVDGSTPEAVPAALSQLREAVMTRARVLPARGIDGKRRLSCERAVSAVAEPDSVVVERTGFAGASLTFARGRALYGCNAIPHPVADPDRPAGSPWCSVSVGRFSGGSLTDPRLSLCQRTGAGSWTAFAWVEPARGAKWIVVHEDAHRFVYEAAGSLPVRVEARRQQTPAQSATSFEIEQYDRGGHKLGEYTLKAAVSG